MRLLRRRPSNEVVYSRRLPAPKARRIVGNRNEFALFVGVVAAMVFLQTRTTFGLQVAELSASSEPNWTSSPQSFWAERVFRAAGDLVLQTVVGVLFLGVISSALNILNVPVDAQLIAKGVIIVAALSLSARAVGATLRRLLSRAQSRNVARGGQPI
jgi:ribose/xylose/arabinose/galactoside ABC-type transport system permease subunit